jgi:hypothetical protein
MLLASGGTDAGTIIFGTAVWVLIIAAYWVPTLVAWTRHVPNLAQVAIVNGFLGWTFVGWVVALVMAAKPVPPAAGAAGRPGPVPPGPPAWPGS